MLSVKLQESTKLWQSLTIQVYVPPFWLCFLNSSRWTGWNFPSEHTTEIVLVTELAWLPGSYEEALGWPPLWWGVISFQNFRRLKLRLNLCVDFLASSKLIGDVDLTDSYEIWPKCSLVINPQKCVRLLWFSKQFFFYALSCDEDRQIFNLLTSK